MLPDVETSDEKLVVRLDEEDSDFTSPVKVVLVNEKQMGIAETYAEEGELRLYRKDGFYTVIPWSAGLMMLCGSETINGMYNLNTTANANYMFRDQNDLTLPDGVTFANVTGWAYTFYNCKRLSLPTTITLRGNCNSTFRSCTMTSQHRIYWEDATTLPCTFGYSDLITHIGGTDIVANCPNVTDLRQTFEGMAGLKSIKIYAPKCVYINGVVCHMPDIEEIYLDCPAATNISIQGDIGGGRFGVCGRSPKLRKVTMICPKLTDWFYACQLVGLYGKATEFRGDMSAASSCIGMFDKWSLDAASVKHISETIKGWTSGSHPITLGIQKSLQNDPDVLADIDAISAKGWTVTVQYNALSLS